MKIIKKGFIILGGIFLAGIIIGVVFLNFSPQFGGEASERDIANYRNSKNFDGEIFLNLQETNMDMDFDKVMSLLGEYYDGIPNQSPSFDIPIFPLDSAEFLKGSRNEIIWFGHSAFLLRLDGKNILLDPMLGENPAPHPWLGVKRFYSTLPMEIAEMPIIDAVFISHDHYDHLDYGSIMELNEKTKMFYVPLGVGVHFRSWGIPENKIIEFDWWEESTLDSIGIVFTPSRHFSGRGLTDRYKTLWGSWVLKGKEDNLFFSGDGGYGPHFKEIGEKYGPFDFALVECGQYNQRWSEIHMMPEESAQAGVDLAAKVVMPIHWGAFSLALHSWTDPVDRIVKEGNRLGIPVVTPEIGKRVFLDNFNLYEDNNWWTR